MASTVQPEWHMEYLIRSYDVDPQMNARLPVFCRLMQEAAWFHAEHLGLGHSYLSSRSMTWVLSRMRIEVNRLPKWGETVSLRTWPSGRDRLFYYRDFEITDEEGNLILQASTAWFVIDTRKRERTVPDWWQTADYPFGPKLFESKLGRLKGCRCEGGESLRINYGDLDQNGHVNNVRYIDWLMNSLPLEFHQTHILQSLEVNYLAEALYGHEVQICTSGADSLQCRHGITAGGEELVRATSAWARS